MCIHKESRKDGEYQLVAAEIAHVPTQITAINWTFRQYKRIMKWFEYIITRPLINFLY